jgi:hypothetical protein
MTEQGIDIPNVIEINRRDVFTLEEALELLPVVFRITKIYGQKVQVIIDRLESLGAADEELVSSLEEQVSQLIQNWQNKLQKLGALPKGLWLADFDSGDGYFCWKFPERSIEYWHHYNDGYTKRMLITDRHKPLSLQDRLRNKIIRLAPLSVKSTPKSTVFPLRPDL